MKTRIGIVEDDPDIRNALAGWLEDSPDYVYVCGFGDAETALAEIPQHQLDVVLMDIRLPGQSGIECTALLRKILPELQIIVITVYRERNLLFEALKAGASGYILKRSSPEEVFRAIAEVRSGGAPMTPEIARMLVDAFRKSEVQPSSAGDGDPSDNLSAREMEILNLIEHGLRNKEIATQLDISYFTVRAHLRKIYEKLHVRCRAGAVAKHLQRKT